MSAAVRKAPWIVIAVILVASFVLGGFASQFGPAEDQNESFAPDAPELTASSEIGATFGSVSRMQVLVTSSTGDVITLDALEASMALEQTLRSSEAGDLLVDTPTQSAIMSHLLPVQYAIAAGAPMPTSDAEVKQLYLAGLEQLPEQFRPFVVSLLSDDADLTTATAEMGLGAITYESSDDFDVLAENALIMADAVETVGEVGTVTQEPFNVDLIFSSTEDFELEVGRLLIAAAMIILLVLAIIFMVRPQGSRERALYWLGIALMIFGAGIAVVPGLANIFPDIFPEAWGDWSLGSVVMAAMAFYVVAFLLWSLTSRRLRRTTADTLLTFLTIGLAIQWMMGYGFLRFEDQSQMAQILPILLIGLGVDYSIHMTTRYRQELSAGNSVDDSISRAIRTVGVALVLATLATAVGFLTNVTSDIPALAEFGELAAVGIIASFILMLTFVPAVRELLDRRAEKHDRLDTSGMDAGDGRLLPRIIGSFSVLPRKFAVGTVVVAIVLAGLGAFSMTNLSTAFSFLDFVPTTSPLRDTAVTVDDRFDFPETTSVLVKGDLTTGAAWNAMNESFVNSVDVEDVEVIELESGATYPLGNSIMSLLNGWLNPAGPEFDADLFNIALEVGFTQQRTVPEDGDVTPLYDAAYAKDPIQMAAVMSEDYTATVFNFDTTAGESGAGDLADGLNEAFAPMADAGASAVTTSNAIINDLVVQSLSDSQVSSLMLTLAAALLLLVINFLFEARRPMLGVITTLPVAIVVVWTFGIMAALGIPFGPVTATISALAIGIGIPYMIHVTHRFLEERAEHPDTDDAMHHTLVHTGGALAGSAVTTILGFGILVTSTTIPFRQFGFVTAYTILLALIAAVLVLPSMLSIWSRWHLRRGDTPAVIDVDEEL